MAYIKRTFKYMFKTFWALALICLPAALALGIFTKPMSSLSYLVAYSETYVKSFKSIFWLIFNRYATKYVYPLVIILIALIFSTALSMSVIEKHFRVGKLMLVSPLKQINNYFLPVLLSFLILSFILLLYGLIQTGMLTMLHMLISGRGYPNVLNMIIASVISLGLFVLAVFAACSTMYWTPMMVIYGFSFGDAAAASLRLLDGKAGGILFGLLTPFIIVAVLESVCSFVTNIYVSCALAVVLYLFLIMYLVSYIMISMFDLSGMERRDEKKIIGGINRGV